MIFNMIGSTVLSTYNESGSGTFSSSVASMTLQRLPKMVIVTAGSSLVPGDSSKFACAIYDEDDSEYSGFYYTGERWYSLSSSNITWTENTKTFTIEISGASSTYCWQAIG